jgi:hypothetical protein
MWTILLGMHTKPSTLFSLKNLQSFSLGIVAIGSAFALGVKSAGDVRPASLIETGSIQQTGDVDGNGVVNISDVQIVLEIAQGYRIATARELRADPNSDGKLTVDDAIRLLTLLPR